MSKKNNMAYLGNRDTGCPSVQFFGTVWQTTDIMLGNSLNDRKKLFLEVNHEPEYHDMCSE
jgi:hypothetical protein